MKRTCIFLIICFSCAFAKFFPASYMGYQKITKSIALELLENPLFNVPVGVAIINFSASDRATFVVDEGWHRVLFSRDGADWIESWGSYGEGNANLKCPLGCCSDDHQNIYITDYGNQRIVQLYFDANDNELQYKDKFELNNQGIPWDVTYWSGAIYVTDCKNHRVLKYDTTGNLISTYGSYGSGNGQFYKPQGIAVIRDTVYIADMGNDRLVALRDLGSNFSWLRTS